MRASALGKITGTGVGTNAGVTVTIAAVTGRFLSATGIQVSGDAAAVVTVESPASTVLYKKRFAAAFNLSEAFDRGALKAAATGQALVVKISASTANCEANIQAESLA